MATTPHTRLLATSFTLHALLLALLVLLPALTRPPAAPSLTLELLPVAAAASAPRQPGAAPAPPRATPAHTPRPDATPTPSRAPAAPTHATVPASRPPAATSGHAPAAVAAAPTAEATAGASGVASTGSHDAPSADATQSASGDGPSVGANWRAAYLRNPAPAYPLRSRERGEEGRVILRVVVGADGRVVSLAVISSSGFARLDRAARDAVQGWRFEPARRGGGAIEDTVDVPVRFSQRDN